MVRAAALALLLTATAAEARHPPAPPAPTLAATTADPAVLDARIEGALASASLDVARDLLVRAAGLLEPRRLALLQAEYLLASGSLDDAAAAFSALQSDPGVGARAGQGLGLTLLRQDKLPAAVTALDAALARDPALLRGWVARGVAADRLRDWAAADNAYARALALDARSAPALINRGYSRLLRGDYAGATTDLTQALLVDPGSTVARNDLRLARAMAGDWKGAFQGASRAGLARDLNTAGFAAMARGEYGLAETYLTRAMQVSPEFDRVAWANLVYLKQLAHKPVEPGAAAR